MGENTGIPLVDSSDMVDGAYNDNKDMTSEEFFKGVRPIFRNLVNDLLKSHPSTMKEIYEYISKSRSDLCPDKIRCSDISSCKADEPRWQHQVRYANYDLSSNTSPHYVGIIEVNGRWQFPNSEMKEGMDMNTETDIGSKITEKLGKIGIISKEGETYHLNNGSVVCVIYSNVQQDDIYQFEVSKSKFKEYGERFRLLLVCGSYDKILIIPQYDLDDLFKDIGISDSWKFHVTHDSKLIEGDKDLSGYLDRWEFLAKWFKKEFIYTDTQWDALGLDPLPPEFGEMIYHTRGTYFPLENVRTRERRTVHNKQSQDQLSSMKYIYDKYFPNRKEGDVIMVAVNPFPKSENIELLFDHLYKRENRDKDKKNTVEDNKLTEEKKKEGVKMEIITDFNDGKISRRKEDYTNRKQKLFCFNGFAHEISDLLYLPITVANTMYYFHDAEFNEQIVKVRCPGRNLFSKDKGEFTDPILIGSTGIFTEKCRSINDAVELSFATVEQFGHKIEELKILLADVNNLNNVDMKSLEPYILWENDVDLNPGEYNHTSILSVKPVESKLPKQITPEIIDMFFIDDDDGIFYKFQKEPKQYEIRGGHDSVTDLKHKHGINKNMPHEDRKYKIKFGFLYPNNNHLAIVRIYKKTDDEMIDIVKIEKQEEKGKQEEREGAEIMINKSEEEIEKVDERMIDIQKLIDNIDKPEFVQLIRSAIKKTREQIEKEENDDKDIKERIEQAAKEIEKVAKDIDTRKFINNIYGIIRCADYMYYELQVKNYIISLMAQPWVCMTGVNGAGKDSLAILVATLCSENYNEQVLEFTASKGLENDNKLVVGYQHALTNKFQYTEILYHIIKSQENPGRPYFIIISEANVANLDSYLVQIATAIESASTKITLPRYRYIDTKSAEPDIKIPKNLFIILTMNKHKERKDLSLMDLDRMNVIDFDRPYLRRGNDRSGENYKEIVSQDPLLVYLFKKLVLDNEFRNLTIRDAYYKIGKYKEWEKKNGDIIADLLDRINAILVKYHMIQEQDANRNQDAILKYSYIAKDIMDDNVAIDLQLSQKVITKLENVTDDNIDAIKEIRELIIDARVITKTENGDDIRHLVIDKKSSEGSKLLPDKSKSVEDLDNIIWRIDIYGREKTNLK